MGATKENKTADGINAVANLVDKVPVYPDALQPAMKQVGKTLELTVRAVNAALLPISGTVWGIEQIGEFISDKVSEKLKTTPIDKIQTPDLNIAGPTIEALKYANKDEVLRELYANLLATSMDMDVSINAHPAFIEIIKQLSPDEARIIKALSFAPDYPEIFQIKIPEGKRLKYCDSASIDLHNKLREEFEGVCNNIQLNNPKNICAYIDNLQRLHLLRIFQITSYDIVNSAETSYSNGKKRTKINSTTLHTFSFNVTDLGMRFIETCVISMETRT